jgi:7-cyano-7-deazaguanine synthase
MESRPSQKTSDPVGRLVVVLLSGGLDSATTAAIARAEGFRLYALSVDYGQRHRFELEAARRVAQSLGVVEHRVLRIDLGAIGGSALTADIDVPQDRPAEEMSSGIPVTYVPARNTVMLSLALGYAEVVGAADIFIGVNAVDYSGYPDCRPEFIAAFEQVANLATKAGVEGALQFRIHAPLIQMTKAEIIRRGMELGVDYALTHSCYAPNDEGVACGRCDACQLRLKGFAEAGLVDPVQYQYKAEPQRAQRTQREDEQEQINRISGKIVDAAMAVHRELGPGLLESAYEACLTRELSLRGLRVERQVPLPIVYAGQLIETAYRMDLLVEDQVIVELKCVEQIAPVHKAQLLSQLKLSKKPLGLLINFYVKLLKEGIVRMAN